MKIKYLLATAVLVTAVLCFAVPVGAQSIGDMTIAQLQAMIAQLMARIQALEAQQSGQTWCYSFATNIGIGDTDTSTNGAVSQLQTALEKSGYDTSLDTSGTFGENTAASVVSFQTKYGIRASGWVGPITRVKLNSLYGCGITPNTNPINGPVFVVNSISSTTQSLNLLAGASTEIYSFSASNNATVAASFSQLKFSIETVGGQVNDFKFFKNGMDISSLSSIQRNSSVLTIMFSNPDVIPAGATNTYTLWATPNGFSGNSANVGSVTTTLTDNGFGSSLDSVTISTSPKPAPNPMPTTCTPGATRPSCQGGVSETCNSNGQWSGCPVTTQTTPLSLTCTGTGLVQVIPDPNLDDGGRNAINDDLQVYCENGLSRFCLSNEPACPWDPNRPSNTTYSSQQTCSTSGIDSTAQFFAHIFAKNSVGMPETWLYCSPDGQISISSSPKISQTGQSSITVTSPNGGEVFTAGQNMNITWSPITAQSGDTLKITIGDYAAGSPPVIIFNNNNELNLSSGVQSYNYAIPSIMNHSSTLKVKLEWWRSGVIIATDESDNYFTINAINQPSITITSPNGGETYKPGDNITVNWKTSGVSSSQKLDVIRLRAYPNGQEYNLASNVLNDGQEIIPIPSYVPVGAYTLEIKSYVDSILVFDASDSYFKIYDSTQPIPTVKVTANSSSNPNPVPSGSDIVIAWNSTNTTSCSVSSNVYSAGGLSPNGSVVVHNLMVSTTFTVTCLTGLSSGSIDASSSVTINVTLPPTTQPSITVISPNGGEQWAQGSTQNITWKSNGFITGKSKLVMVYLMGGNIQQAYGVSGIGIKTSVNVDNGSVSWQVPTNDPGITPGQYKIRIYWQESGYQDIVTDTSDNYFTIISPATSQQTTGYCEIRDSYTNTPSQGAPDVGKGYAKMAKSGTNTISGLQSVCSATDYSSLLSSYCAQNTNPVQQQVVTYNASGNFQSLSCGSFGCNFVSCPTTTPPPSTNSSPSPATGSQQFSSSPTGSLNDTINQLSSVLNADQLSSLLNAVQNYLTNNQ